MEGNNLIKKGIAVAVILLFVSVSIISSTGGIAREKHDSTENLLLSSPMVSNTVSPDVTVILNGTIGENGWYVSCVVINITTDDNVSTVYYSIDNGSWQTFDGVPIVVCDDGLHIFCWYYVDNEGNESDVECIYFKIDQTPSTIEILWEQIDLDIVFTAECNDATSGVDRVEFYVENELLYIDLEEPFTWIPAQPDIYPLKVIAYDNAGNNIDEIPPGNTPDFYHFIGFILPPEYSATCIRFRAVFVFYRWTITSPDGPVVIDWRPVIGRKTTHLLNHYIGSIGTFFIHATFNDGQY